jgi:hypothetical protein
MDHSDWVKSNLKDLARSLGFRYTPLEEIEGRLKRLRIGMEKKEIEAL